MPRLPQSNDLAIYIRVKVDWNSAVTVMPAKDTSYTISSQFRAAEGTVLGVRSTALTYTSPPFTFKANTANCPAPSPAPVIGATGLGGRRLRLF